jgi:hypothetical protein
LSEKEYALKPNIIIGIVALVIGGALLVVGINASNSVVDQVSSTFLGRFTQATTWYIIGGIGAAVFGVLMIVLGLNGKKLS